MQRLMLSMSFLLNFQPITPYEINKKTCVTSRQIWRPYKAWLLFFYIKTLNFCHLNINVK